MKKCPICDSNTTESFTKVTRSINGKKIVVQNVPCFHCLNDDHSIDNSCGLNIIHSSILEKVEEHMKRLHGEFEETVVHNYSDLPI